MAILFAYFWFHIKKIKLLNICSVFIFLLHGCRLNNVSEKDMLHNSTYDDHNSFITKQAKIRSDSESILPQNTLFTNNFAEYALPNTLSKKNSKPDLLTPDKKGGLAKITMIGIGALIGIFIDEGYRAFPNSSNITSERFLIEDIYNCSCNALSTCKSNLLQSTTSLARSNNAFFQNSISLDNITNSLSSCNDALILCNQSLNGYTIDNQHIPGCETNYTICDISLNGNGTTLGCLQNYQSCNSLYNTYLSQLANISSSVMNLTGVLNEILNNYNSCSGSGLYPYCATNLTSLNATLNNISNMYNTCSNTGAMPNCYTNYTSLNTSYGILNNSLNTCNNNYTIQACNDALSTSLISYTQASDTEVRNGTYLLTNPLTINQINEDFLNITLLGSGFPIQLSERIKILDIFTSLNYLNIIRLYIYNTYIPKIDLRRSDLSSDNNLYGIDINSILCINSYVTENMTFYGGAWFQASNCSRCIGVYLYCGDGGNCSWDTQNSLINNINAFNAQDEVNCSNIFA